MRAAAEVQGFCGRNGVSKGLPVGCGLSGGGGGGGARKLPASIVIICRGDCTVKRGLGCSAAGSCVFWAVFEKYTVEGETRQPRRQLRAVHTKHQTVPPPPPPPSPPPPRHDLSDSNIKKKTCLFSAHDKKKKVVILKINRRSSFFFFHLL